jgi:4-hydroxy-tetrahydrodipicolinate synthase
MSSLNLEGIIPAVIVPMQADYSIDYLAFERYLEWVIGQGAIGLAVNVDTGEGPYLSPDERSRVIQAAQRVASGRCPIIAGVGGPGTLNAITNARAARREPTLCWFFRCRLFSTILSMPASSTIITGDR